MKRIIEFISEFTRKLIILIKYKHLLENEELEQTNTGIDNTVPIKYLKTCNNTLKTVIEPLRKRFPDLVITSWFRSEAVNKKVGGAPKSSHLTGEAIDCYSPSVPLATLLKYIIKHVKPSYTKVYKTHIHITKKMEK